MSSSLRESIHIAISPIGAQDNLAVSRAMDNLIDFPRAQRGNWAVTPTASASVQWPMRSPHGAAEHARVCRPGWGSRRKVGSAAPVANVTEKAESEATENRTRFALSIPNRSIISMTVVNSFLCFGMDDGSVQLYNLDDNIVLPPVRTSHGAVMALLGDDERNLVVSACSASTVCLWRLRSSGQLQLLRVISCDGMGDILGVCFLGKSLFAGFSDTFVRCVVEDIDRIPGLFDDNGWAPGQVSLGDSAFVEGDNNDSALSRIVAQLPAKSNSRDPHFGFVFAVASCAAGNYLVSGCGDGAVRVWDRVSGKCEFYRDGHGGAVTALAVHEGECGAVLFSGSRDQTIKVWDVSSGFICKRTLRKHKTDIVFLTISDGRLYSGSSDGVTHVWCADTLRHYGQCRDNMIASGTVSARYQLLFTASDDGMVFARDTCMFQKKTEKSKKKKASIRSSSVAGVEFIGDAPGHSARSVGMRGASPLTPVMTLPIRSGVSDKVECYGDDDASEDDADTLVYGLSNDLVLAPPNSALFNSSSPRALRLSKKGIAESMRLTETKHIEDAPTVSHLPIEAITAHEAEHAAFGDFVNRTPNGVQEKGLARGDSSGTTSSDDTVYVEVGEKEIQRELADGENVASRSIQMLEERLLQDVLARFVSFATVSGVEEYREDCWQGARYIGSFLEGLGASVKYVATSSVNESKLNARSTTPSVLDMRTAKSPTVSSNNPIVLARFAAFRENSPTLTFYGHYDVMPADSAGWDSDPWKLTPLNGRLYGRGVTDNKGPILAMIFAVKSILDKAKDGLKVNIVLVLEGEGEMSNKGFHECIDTHQQWFQDTSLILTSNSYWLGEERPCITYGMRGVVDLQVTVSGPSRNLHSGVDGGAVFEPVIDLLAIMGTLVDSSGIACVPGFYDDVRPLSEEDKKRLADVEFDLEEYRAGTGVSRFVSPDPSTLLELRWRRPSISVTSLETSNTTGTHSVVPREAMAKLSIRYVPDQSPKKMEKAVRTHLEFELRRRRSPNTLKMVCVNSGDSWLGDPSCDHFQIASKAVREVWGVEPQYVCEGGTMPLFSFLSKKLNAPIVQVPLGQSSDAAHLPNERIRILNLHKGKQVLQRIIEELCEGTSG